MSRKLKTLKDINVKNKRVLMRVDFDVALDNKGNIVDDFRIKRTLPTIEYLIKQGAKIILMAHLDRPKGEKIEKLKMNRIQEKLLEYLDYSIVKAPDCVGKKIEQWTKQMQPGEILLLENLRFYAGEEKNDSEFAKQLAQLGDVYINEAFAVSHREHASVVGVPKYLPSAAGFVFKKELEELGKIFHSPKRPLVVIIGGVKVATKIKVVKKFLNLADKLLLGGVLINTIFAAQGIDMGKSFIEKDMFKTVKKLDLENPKFQLPVDFVAWSGLDSDEVEIQEVNTIKENELVFDIGPRTLELFLDSIKKAKMIVWNGPLGKIEKKPFDKGSEIIAKAVAKSEAYSIVGGGDTVAFVRELGLERKINYLSTGGGAMLEYLANETLPGIKALKNEQAVENK